MNCVDTDVCGTCARCHYVLELQKLFGAGSTYSRCWQEVLRAGDERETRTLQYLERLVPGWAPTESLPDEDDEAWALRAAMPFGPGRHWRGAVLMWRVDTHPGSAAYYRPGVVDASQGMRLRDDSAALAGNLPGYRDYRGGGLWSKPGERWVDFFSVRP